MAEQNTVHDVMRKGFSGPVVAELQSALVQMGLLTDGTFTPSEFDDATEIAVASFQSREGMEQSGIVDAKTKRALAAAIGQPQPILDPGLADRVKRLTLIDGGLAQAPEDASASTALVPATPPAPASKPFYKDRGFLLLAGASLALFVAHYLHGKATAEEDIPEFEDFEDLATLPPKRIMLDEGDEDDDEDEEDDEPETTEVTDVEPEGDEAPEVGADSPAEDPIAAVEPKPKKRRRAPRRPKASEAVGPRRAQKPRAPKTAKVKKPRKPRAKKPVKTPEAA